MIEIQDLYHVPICSFRFTFQNSEMDQNKKFECEKCGKTYKFKSILLLHSMKCDEISLENKNKEKNITETQFDSQQNQTIKDKEYTVITGDDSSEKYQCKICEMKFDTQKLRLQHHYLTHKEMKFKCEKCEKLFPFKSLCKSHIIVCGRQDQKQKLINIDYCINDNESSGKKYQCLKCEKRFGTSLTIRQHIYHRHKDRHFRCEHCNKLFPFNHTLKHHKKICHEKEHLNTKCNICQKAFDNYQALLYHRVYSHRYRKFKCEKCDKLFPHKSSLKFHGKVCGGEEKNQTDVHLNWQFFTI